MPGGDRYSRTLFTFLGPGRIWIVARVDIADSLRGAQVTSPARGIESGLKHGAEDVYRVDVVPIGAERSAASTHSSTCASPRRAG